MNIENKISLTKFGNHNLPSNRDYLNWGTRIAEYDDLIIMMEPLNTLQYFIYPKVNKIEIYKDNVKVLTFYDSIEDVGSADFKRVIDNYTYYIKNDEIVLKIKILPTKFLSKLKIKIWIRRRSKYNHFWYWNIIKK